MVAIAYDNRALIFLIVKAGQIEYLSCAPSDSTSHPNNWTDIGAIIYGRVGGRKLEFMSIISNPKSNPYKCSKM